MGTPHASQHCPAASVKWRPHATQSPPLLLHGCCALVHTSCNVVHPLLSGINPLVSCLPALHGRYDKSVEQLLAYLTHLMGQGKVALVNGLYCRPAAAPAKEN